MEGDGEEVRLAELNKSLTTLSIIFPKVLPDVFRELLLTFDGESGLYVAIEQLLRHQDQWVKGRWRKDNFKAQSAETPASSNHTPLFPLKDAFRRNSYKKAVRKAISEEFKALSKSKLDAVLAEENYYYTQARPTLEQLASKSWRNSLHVFLSKWRRQSNSVAKDHFMVVWPTSGNSKLIPTLKPTGDSELDEELRQRVLQPLLWRIFRDRAAEDWNVAMSVNNAEAENAQAIYECECCYSDSTWEQVATCATNGHIICFDCIWRGVSEAIFGQSWTRNIDHAHGQVKCLALGSHESCDGNIPQELSRRAILQNKGGSEALIKLETRLAEEAMRASCLPLVHCPFCTYVEVDDLYLPPSTIRCRLNTHHFRYTCFLLLTILGFLPLFLCYALLSWLLPFWRIASLGDMFSESIAHASRKKHLPKRFQCRSPQCGLPSCLSCQKAWHDPHVCFESASLSLRTTVEAARTAALKRTCPCCGLGFIKDSGCNKLTCVCGYTMCYTCRQGLKGGSAGEGYRHFCQHFRPAGGVCRECDKCDLYRSEDDDILVKRAGAIAEKEWREKEGLVGVEGLVSGQASEVTRIWWDYRWTVQDVMNWWVDQVLIC